MISQRTVVCVVSAEQQSEYKAEFELLRHAGINLIFQGCPELALSQIGEVDPWLVIVGMEIGWTEGLEFLALLTRRYADSRKITVLLPSKEDPFPPVVHYRNPSTGRSTTQEIELDQIVARLVDMAASAPEAWTAETNR